MTSAQARAQARAMVVAVEAAVAAADMPTRPSFFFLVVDDSPMTRKMLCRTLQSHKHTCEVADDGQEAVSTVQDKLASGAPFYDAILMDYGAWGLFLCHFLSLRHFARHRITSRTPFPQSCRA